MTAMTLLTVVVECAFLTRLVSIVWMRGYSERGVEVYGYDQKEGNGNINMGLFAQFRQEKCV